MDRALKRISYDIKDYNNDPIEGTSIYVDETDIKKIIVAIVGSTDSMYENGVYFFEFIFSSNYPHEPPKGKFLNWQNTNDRMHPNMYKCGKLCLSILGTWQGPSWTSVMTLKSIILNIQALLDDNPLVNEPGYDKNTKSLDHINYAKIVNYLNYRDFVNGTLNSLINNSNIYVKYFEVFLKKHFKDNKESINNMLDKLIIEVPIQKISVNYAYSNANINYNLLKTQFNSLIEKI